MCLKHICDLEVIFSRKLEVFLDVSPRIDDDTETFSTPQYICVVTEPFCLDALEEHDKHFIALGRVVT